MKWNEAVREFFQPAEAVRTIPQAVAQASRGGVALLLSALMIMVPMGQGTAFAQEIPAQASPSASPAPVGEPMTEAQLNQLVAPIALYPDSLVAQVLAASTYPTQVVEADRWLQSQGNAPASQIAAGADAHTWDASVKALCAFPSVLAQMDKNIQWTTDLGNAYYNQPQDVMDAVQGMRHKAQGAGNLRSTPQQVVAEQNDAITIAPANPEVVYVPAYDPWAVWGYPVAMYPGFYWAAPPGIFWGGLAVGFGLGIGIGLWGGWGWGWGHWGCGWGRGWGGHGVFYNHGMYTTHSATVMNRGFGRPGGPPRSFAGTRGSYARAGARPGGGYNRGGAGYNRGGAGYNRGGAGYNRGGAGAYRGGTARPGGTVGRPGGGSYGRPGGGTSMSRPGGSGGSRPSMGGSRGMSAPRSSGGGGHVSSGHVSSGHSSGGGHASGGGHSGGGGHRR
jgi:hypothetical protein